MIRKFIIAAMFACFFTTPQFAFADSEEGSFISLIGLSAPVIGSTYILHGATELTVASIKTAGEVSTAAFKASGGAATFSVEMSKEMADGASLAVGKVVNVVALSTGHILEATGKVIAFIPNEVGKAILLEKE